MLDYTIRAANENDLARITHLANQNVFEQLSEADRQTGFLTGRFELLAMQKMIASATSAVTYYHQELAGFVINSKLPTADYPPLVQTMAEQFSTINFRNSPLLAYNYFFYGPVLVSKPHRGKGLLSGMFRETIALLRGQFQIGLAFIHMENHHSLKIHTSKLGMEIVGQFSYKGDNYYILAFALPA